MKIIRIFAIALLVLITPLVSANLALADTVSSQSINNTKQAAQEVIKDTGAKQIFGKSENGEQLIDNAKAKASQKLDTLAKKAESQQELPDSQKLFLNNLDDKN